MPALPTELRRKLEAAIGRESDTGGARAIAETAATAALNRLDVDRAEPRSHLNDAERKLRVKLRARARQLGDRLRDGKQGIDRLVEACAYEHWHRMLFARFLAENDLLRHPDDYCVTIADCAEFAAEEGVDTWEIAGRYASRALPQIFRPDDPLLAVNLAAEHRKSLEGVLAGLPAEVFTASDSLGWVYQFWQARRKKQVNESEVKIGADELPAVTQLFTEPYMVAFLLQNTLGAWWVGSGRALPGPMPYLRMLEEGAPAAGRFEGWPKTAKELKVLDPCCGSGHFLVAAFEILVGFRVAEGLTPREACDAVLRENVHGLELDNRCVQIAAFALAMAAWTYPQTNGYRPLPGMNLACSGLSVAPMPMADETEAETSRRKEDTKKIRDRWVRSGKDMRQQRGMGRMFDLFVDAPVLGSLIDPTRDMPESLLCAPANELRPVLERVLNEESVDVDAEEHENHVAARGIAEAARLLSDKYTLIATNVPYLSRLSQTAMLDDWCGANFPEARTDIATVFIDRCRALLGPAGTLVVVSPTGWLFLSTYTKFRRRLLTNLSWSFAARLGPGAFDGISGEVVNVTLTALSNTPGRPDAKLTLIDAGELRGAASKAGLLLSQPSIVVSQGGQVGNPDSRIIFGEASTGTLLGRYADAYSGQRTGDYPRFSVCFWELREATTGWERFGTTVDTTVPDGGCQNLLFWEDGRGQLAQYQANLAETNYASGGWKQGWQAWGKQGVRVSQMGNLPVAIHRGDHFDNNCAVIVPHKPDDLPAIWAFCSSPGYTRAVRHIDTSLKVTNATLVKIPFDLSHWKRMAAEQYPDGLPVPYSEDATQWLFKGTVTPSNAPLQVAVARLLGYRWPDQPADALDALADDDGVVCIPPVAGEVAGAERLRTLLLRAGAPSSQTTSQLNEWLRNRFFEEHCKLFHHRPFIWQVWDGHKEGFSALVNYHRLDHKTLESLTFHYLGDWITRQRAAAKGGESGATERLGKAEDLQRRLKLILAGEQPHDIFVRWKPLERQPVGWDPDLNDGVRLNIRPFIEADVLRWKPNIKWGKDRGKNPPGAPWGEDRDNDTHLTLAEKTAAREK